MNLQRIATIFRKDVQDAIRDSRVLVALLVPLGIGIFYNFAFDDDPINVEAKVAFWSADSTMLPSYIDTIIGDSAEVLYAEFSSAQEVRNEVASEDADIGLIIPAGFDAAIDAGEYPELEVVRGPGTSIGADYVAAAIEPALRTMSDQAAPAFVTVTIAAEPGATESVIDRVGLRNWAVGFSMIMMIAMIAMLAVPIILAEENEKKTLDALVLIASYREVVFAKALVGLFYLTIMIPLLLVLTMLRPEGPLLFVATVLTLALALIGFGLLMAGFFKNANQLNTWAGILLLPVIAPAVIIGLPVPDGVELVAGALPTGAGAKLLLNGLNGEDIFPRVALQFAIIVAWGAAAYLLLLWQLSRRQA